MVDFTLTVNNTGLYPSRVEMIDTLPNGLSYVSHTARYHSRNHCW
ncbi:MAG: DUF11 domain-containing protein [Chloroflexi bacterium]|nr:DUF11 domain-containing protein [Chloroflexota bacterium]